MIPDDGASAIALMADDGTLIDSQDEDVLEYTFVINKDMNMVGYCGYNSCIAPSSITADVWFLRDWAEFEYNVGTTSAGTISNEDAGKSLVPGDTVTFRLSVNTGYERGIPSELYIGGLPESYYDKDNPRFDFCWFWHYHSPGYQYKTNLNFVGSEQYVDWNGDPCYASPDEAVTLKFSHYYKARFDSYCEEITNTPSKIVMFGDWAYLPDKYRSEYSDSRIATVEPFNISTRPIFNMLTINIVAKTYKEAGVGAMVNMNGRFYRFSDSLTARCPESGKEDIYIDIVSSDSFTCYGLAQGDADGKLIKDSFIKSEVQGYQAIVRFVPPESVDGGKYVLNILLWPWPKTTDAILYSMANAGAVLSKNGEILAEYCDIPKPKHLGDYKIWDGRYSTPWVPIKVIEKESE
jgi:hypothetical protein